MSVEEFIGIAQKNIVPIAQSLDKHQKTPRSPKVKWNQLIQARNVVYKLLEIFWNI